MTTSLALQTYRYSRLALRTLAPRRQSVSLWEKSPDPVRRDEVAAAIEVAASGILEARAEALRLLGPEEPGVAPPPCGN